MEELDRISGNLHDLLAQFSSSHALGLYLASTQSAEFRSLAIEAKSILDDELGPVNDFSLSLARLARSGGSSMTGSPTYADVEETEHLVRTARRAVSRKHSKIADVPIPNRHYVDPKRVFELSSLHGGEWDYTRLIELCRELNVAAGNSCHMSTAMLIRSILNHVPPIFGFRTFAEVANNTGGSDFGKSFRASMQRLQMSLRNIADMHLHEPIRNKEAVPTAVQVDFSADLDVLLGEIVRLGRTP